MTGESNDVVLDVRSKKHVQWGFIILTQSKLQECPNLQPAFLSFAETLHPSHRAELQAISFIDTASALDWSDFQKTLKYDKELYSFIQSHGKSSLATNSTEKNEEDDEPEDDGAPATSLEAIDYIKSALASKLDLSHTYMNYVEDAKRMIKEHLQNMETIYQSDLAPVKQKKVITMIKQNMQAISEEMARISVLGIEHMKKQEALIEEQVDAILLKKRFSPH